MWGLRSIISCVLMILVVLCIGGFDGSGGLHSGLGVGALEASWLPADDGPLPLSTAYRENVRKLCEATKDGTIIPGSVDQADAKKIVMACKKLREYPTGLDDATVPSSSSSMNWKGLLVAGAVAAGFYWYSTQKRTQTLSSSSSSSSSAGLSFPNISFPSSGSKSLTDDELRQARAARYASS
jgi:hypothetical protein